LIFLAIFLSFFSNALAFAIFFYPLVNAFLGFAPNFLVFFNLFETPYFAGFFLVAASASSSSA
jgi:hypothetical protein